MENKNNTAIHFLVSDESNQDIHNIIIEAWREEKNVEYKFEGVFKSNFTLLEEVRFFADNAVSPSFTRLAIHTGRKLARGHSARSFEKFLKEKTEEPGVFTLLTVSNKEEYLALRSKIFLLYLESPFIKFESL